MRWHTMRTTRRTTWLPTLTLALMVVAIAGCGLPFNGVFHTPQTLAQNGGVRLTLEVACPATDTHCTIAAQMQNEISILTQRAQNGLGIADASVKRLDATHIQVDLPGTQNTPRVADVLAKRGQIDILDTGDQILPVGQMVQPGAYPVVFTGAQIDPNSVTVTVDANTRQGGTGQPIVTFAFQGSARQAFADYTEQHISQSLTIALDNVIIESTTIQSQIDGQAQITGLGSQTNAQALAAYLKSRPLPLPVVVVSETYIQPTH
ncbi:MAG: hypothetical protein ABI068_16490 [Ktedonobacterales bacterium]